MANGYHDVRLPTDIERGAVGGARFKTTVLQLESGFEQRNIDWARVRGEWDVGYGLLRKEDEAGLLTDLDDLINFFHARQGRAFSFRFKDFADFEIGDPNDPVSDNQSIGTGDGSTVAFQVIKRYTSGSETYDKSVNKIVTDSETVFVAAVQQNKPGDYTINDNTGIITFTSAPANLDDISIACEYDNHVRFDTDKLDINLEIFNVGSWPNIPIVEVRGTGV